MRPKTPPSQCPVCGRLFDNRGFPHHVKAHADRLTVQRRQDPTPGRSKEPAVRRRPIQRRLTVAEKRDPSVWSPAKPSVVVLEVIEELSEAELERLLHPGNSGHESTEARTCSANVRGETSGPGVVDATRDPASSSAEGTDMPDATRPPRHAANAAR